MDELRRGVRGSAPRLHSGDYPKAVQILQSASGAEQRNGEIHLLLAKTYYEMEDRDGL